MSSWARPCGVASSALRASAASTAAYLRSRSCREMPIMAWLCDAAAALVVMVGEMEEGGRGRGSLRRSKGRSNDLEVSTSSPIGTFFPLSSSRSRPPATRASASRSRSARETTRVFTRKGRIEGKRLKQDRFNSFSKHAQLFGLRSLLGRVK